MTEGSEGSALSKFQVHMRYTVFFFKSTEETTENKNWWKTVWIRLILIFN